MVHALLYRYLFAGVIARFIFESFPFDNRIYSRAMSVTDVTLRGCSIACDLFKPQPNVLEVSGGTLVTSTVTLFTLVVALAITVVLLRKATSETSSWRIFRRDGGIKTKTSGSADISAESTKERNKLGPERQEDMMRPAKLARQVGSIRETQGEKKIRQLKSSGDDAQACGTTSSTLAVDDDAKTVTSSKAAQKVDDDAKTVTSSNAVQKDRDTGAGKKKKSTCCAC